MNHVSSDIPSEPPPPLKPPETVITVLKPEKRRTEIAAPQSVLQNLRKIAATIRSFVAFALPNSGEIKDLTDMEKEFIRQAADVIFPKDGAIPLSGTEAGVPEYMENLFQKTPAHTRRLMHLMFHFIECSPLVFGPRRTLFTLLNDEEKKEVLDFSNKSMYFRRVALQSLRVLFTMGYMANEDVKKAVGCVPNQNPFGLK